MSTLLITIHVLTSIFLILLVLVQSGKGAEVAASFGGSSQTVFGSSGGANFFTRLTALMATIFMITSILLTLQSSQSNKSVFTEADSAPVDQKATPSSEQKPTDAPASTDTK